MRSNVRKKMNEKISIQWMAMVEMRKMKIVKAFVSFFECGILAVAEKKAFFIRIPTHSVVEVHNKINILMAQNCGTMHARTRSNIELININ